MMSSLRLARHDHMGVLHVQLGGQVDIEHLEFCCLLYPLHHLWYLVHYLQRPKLVA